MHRLLDINDRDIGLLSAGQIHRAPGYATLDNKELVFGSEARAISRLNPGLSANQYWRDLSTQKSTANFPAIRHQADLVWNQLQSFDSEALKQISLVAVPSHYGKDQISLLSGILKSLNVSETLICKRSLLMASLCPEAEYHIDFQLHQLVVTKMENQGSEIVCGEMVEHPGLGLLGCSDVLLKAIQSRFIEKTRFDPLHHAVTEQQLFNQIMEQLLPQVWSRIDLAIELGDQKSSIELSEQQLELAAQSYLQKIAEVIPEGSYVADQIFGNLPINSDKAILLSDTEITAALEEVLSGADLEQEYSELTAIRSRPKNTSIAEASKPVEPVSTVDADEVEMAAVPQKRVVEVSEADTTSQVSPSHILFEGRAQPASSSLIVVQNNRIAVVAKEAASEDIIGRFSFESGKLFLVSDSGLSLNGSPVSGSTELSVKDLISHDDYAGTLVAIRVVIEIATEALNQTVNQIMEPS